MKEEKLIQACDHIERIIDEINKKFFNESFKLIPDPLNIDFTYLSPMFNINDSEFILLNYEYMGEYFRKFEKLINILVDKKYEIISTYTNDNLNLEQFRQTMDMDDDEFALWFRFNY
jgi:hypothetical protein